MIISALLIILSLIMLALMIKGYFDYLKFKSMLKKWQDTLK